MDTGADGRAQAGALPESGVTLRIVGGADAPWPGRIVRGHDGRTALYVDAALLSDWPGWRADPDGHLLAPLDVERTASGHDVILPLCLRRVDDLLHAREEADAVLSDGEVVTVAVSILRGCVEAAVLGSPWGGQWWITEHGRPVLALDSDPAADSTAESLLASLAAGRSRRLAGALDGIADVLTDPRRLHREVEDHEDAVFACAAAEPLVTTILAPARARRLTGTAGEPGNAGATDPAPATAREARAAVHGPIGALRAAIARHIDAEVADDVAGTISRTTDAAWERVRRTAKSKPGRRKDDQKGRAASRPARRRWAPALVAGSLGCAVLTAGLLWPSGDEPASAGPAPRSSTLPDAVALPAASNAPEGAGAAVPAATAGPQEEGDPTASHDASTEPSAPEDVTPAATELPHAALPLLAAAAACAAGAAPCAAAVWEDAARGAPEGALALPEEERTVALVEEFGGVAVLRLTPTSRSDGRPPEQLVVIVSADGKWVVRDAYDVADHP